MSETEFSYEQVEAFGSIFSQNLDTLFEPTTTGQERSFTIDTFTLGQTFETITELTPEQKTMVRKELYVLLGIPQTEPLEPEASYTIPSDDPDSDDFAVKVFRGEYRATNASSSLPAYLHEIHYGLGDGDIGWVVSASPEPPGELVSTGDGDKSDPNEAVFEDPSPIEVPIQPSTLEYALATVNLIKSSFPEYSVTIDSVFSKGKYKGSVWLHQEKPNDEGIFPAITITATPTAYKYNLGYIETDGKGNLVFGIEELPKCVPTKQPNGSTNLQYPDHTWGFKADDVEKKEKSFAEMMAMLTLLRTQGVF